VVLMGTLKAGSLQCGHDQRAVEDPGDLGALDLEPAAAEARIEVAQNAIRAVDRHGRSDWPREPCPGDRSGLAG
jgi:hypothetical protein